MKGIITHSDNIQEDIARYRYIQGDIAMVKKDWRTNCMDENDTTKMTKNVIRTLKWTFLMYNIMNILVVTVEVICEWTCTDGGLFVIP